MINNMGITLVDSVFLFVFVFVLLSVKLPNIQSDNYIKHKFILFITIFTFNFLLDLIKQIKKGCKINIYDISLRSLLVGLLSILAYSVYMDFTIMKWSQMYFAGANSYDMCKKYGIISCIIATFILLFKAVNILSNNNSYQVC